MIQIRNSVFETNSSSVHAICIQNAPVTIPQNIYMMVTANSFGWENRTINSKLEKLSYLSAAIGEDEHLRQSLISALNRLGIQVEFCENPSLWVGGDYGYIDHSEDTVPFVYHVLSDDDLLARFIFGDDSYVETGNDNNNYTPYLPRDYDGVCFLKSN